MRYAHTNIVSNDWRKLADFYIAVFGCVEKPPERNLSGEWLERSTGVAGAAIRGMHLILPGYGEHGPTLEIFTYAANQPLNPGPANRRGFGHIAFEVENVVETARQVVAHGGAMVGEIAETTIPGVGIITVVYVADPEGNIVELQSWKKERSGFQT